MSQWDVDYLGLCSRILTEGVRVPNRTGVDTVKVPSHTFRFDLGKEFPIYLQREWRAQLDAAQGGWLLSLDSIKVIERTTQVKQ